MTEEERRAWIRTLVVLAVVAAARWGWAHRPGGPELPGTERDVAAAVDSVRGLRSDEERRARPLAIGETLDPNRADPVELDRLPGVGPATAEAIVEARRGRPFGRAEDLLRVRGIGPATLARLEPYIRIPPGSANTAPTGRIAEAERIDVNRAGPVDLETLPGIGPALAERIILDREAAGPYAHADELLRVRGIGPATLDRIRGRIRVR